MQPTIGHKTIFFNPTLAMTPPIVSVFTELRQGEYKVNSYGYVELTCDVPLCDAMLAGDVASKLTAALSVHLDCFLGLSCMEANLQKVVFSARFSNLMDIESVATEIRLKAADIIDTLLVMSEK